MPVLAPDRLAFLQRLAEARSRPIPQVREHLVALENRIAQAGEALALGHTGTARAFLEIARHEFDAALHALPEL